ncbi:hypothetical protein BT69DRAFT_1302483 [Atractiella rhizophila]|nr:hypothetical protein BT69DRAFT_1302483 [Atractiella rhizophila]
MTNDSGGRPTRGQAQRKQQALRARQANLTKKKNDVVTAAAAPFANLLPALKVNSQDAPMAAGCRPSDCPIDPVLSHGDEEVDADEERESVIGNDEAEEKEEYSEEEDMGDWMLEDEVVPLTRERREELLIVLDELPGSVYDELMKEKDKEQWEVGEEVAILISAQRKRVRNGRSKRHYEETGEVPVSNRGRHVKTYSLLNDEKLCADMRVWLREQKWNMDPTKIRNYTLSTLIPQENHKYAQMELEQQMPKGLKHYIEISVFPHIQYKPGKRGIALSTACRWLKREGFKWTNYKKGLYIELVAFHH